MNPSRAITVAAAQYGVEYLAGWDAYAGKMSRLVAGAVDRGARLLVFPEYAAMELASLLSPEAQRRLDLQLAGLQPLLPAFLDLHRALAVRHGVYLLAGSFPVEVGPRIYHNRAHLFGPSGTMGFQDKRVMTRFENEQWHVSPGDVQRTFETDFGRIAVHVCYDIEFPLPARQAVEAGAEILLAPSCTDTRAGYHRVRIGCQARALENQCFVVQAPLVGTAAWSEAIDVNVGAAGIFGPVDAGFPDDGVLALGTPDLPGWTFATLDLEGVRAIRDTGQVFNHRDWPRQFGGGPVEVVAL